MADIDSQLRLWSATASSNKPTGATSIGANLDDNLRAIQSVVRQYLASPGSTIASSSTVDLSTADGHTIPISGTSTVTSYGTEVSGIEYLLTATGAHVIKNSSALALPGAADITTASGDYWLVESKGSGNWVVPFFTRASGQPLVAGTAGNGVSVTGALISVITGTQTQMQSATLTSVLATPGNMQYHPGVAKAWINFNGSASPSINASYNISSITRTGTGIYQVAFVTPFAGSFYCAAGLAMTPSITNGTLQNPSSSATGAVLNAVSVDNAAFDATRIQVVFYGTQ